MVLCYKNGKVQYTLSYVLRTTTPVNGYDIDPDSCSYDFLKIHFIVAILIVAGLYSAIKLSMKIYRHLSLQHCYSLKGSTDKDIVNTFLSV